MVDAPPKLRLRSPKIAESSVKRRGQFVEIIGASIGQCVVHLVPYGFVGVEFRRIGRETLQVNSRELATEFADRFTLVRLAVVPDHNDLATQVTKQMAEELTPLGWRDVLAVKPAIQSETAARGADRHRGDGGDLVVLVAVSDDRSLSARSPRTTNRRDQQVSGFVDKGDIGTQPRRVSFMRGQSRCFHASIAASSRCVARFSGFWQVQFSEWRSRPTWSRWY